MVLLHPLFSNPRTTPKPPTQEVTGQSGAPKVKVRKQLWAVIEWRVEISRSALRFGICSEQVSRADYC